MTRLVTPCSQGACIVLEARPGGGLILSNTRDTGSTPVTAAEVRAFAAAVHAGHFDELLGPAPHTPAAEAPHVHIHVHNDGLVELAAGITRLETAMATEAEQISNLSASVDDVIGDVRAALDILRAERDNLGEAGQAALDELTAKVAAFDTEIGDADSSDTPPAEPTA